MLPRAWRGLIFPWTAACLLLGGCSYVPDQINPVTWWHDLSGGAIAEQRPPPPNADAPYPNLSTVPAKPTPPTIVERQKIADGLIADRANAHYAADQAPLPPPRPRAAVPPLPPPDPNAMSASLAAVSTPSPPARPPARAALTPVQQAPLAAPATPQSQPSLPQQSDTQPVPPAPPPTVPDSPPPPPQIPGTAVALTTPAPPPTAPPAPPPTPAALSAAAAAAVPVAFPPGSAILPPGGDAPLHALAARRGTASIDVIGYGEATDTQPDVQTAGITLGLARAHAMAAALVASGVPMTAIRIESEASGRGGAARLVN
jgi:outer membrane protein OmpA-like peptidoglycan-associated protein